MEAYYAAQQQQQQQQHQHQQQQQHSHAAVMAAAQQHRPPPQHVMPSPQKKGGKRKKVKDPNRPKRPTSAYFYFVQKEREECEKRGEKITRVAEWTKQISAVWRALTPQEKVQFDKKAAIDKARYTEQMIKYKGKDVNRPKRPMSAYFLWLADFRVQMKTKIPENKEMLRQAGIHWKALTEVEKAPYERKAEEERKKYEENMRVYSQGGGAAGAAAAVAAAAAAKRPRMDGQSDVASMPMPTHAQAQHVPQTHAPQPHVQPQHVQHHGHIPTMANNGAALVARPQPPVFQQEQDDDDEDDDDDEYDDDEDEDDE